MLYIINKRLFAFKLENIIIIKIIQIKLYFDVIRYANKYYLNTLFFVQISFNLNKILFMIYKYKFYLNIILLKIAK